MPSSPNKLSLFWQELKRRNVIRVITVYAGAAFVIIELINNITEPLRLPEWTPTLVIVLLAIGFPIVIIFSWLYDIHPEGGMVKTEPADQVKAKDVPKSSNSWKIATYVSLVVIVAMILTAVFKPFSSLDREQDMTIMVLPFLNDSPGEGDDYIVNGLLEEILNKLTLIEELEVKSRTTSEKYRDSPKSSREIAREVGVRYILEGSAQTIADISRIRLQLIEANQDRHLWAKPYEREISLENLFDVQEELSRAVADELEIVLNLKVKEQIEKKLTENMDAYEAYLQAADLLMTAQYLTGQEQGVKLNNAKRLLESAIKLDSRFSDAYSSLGSIYIDNLFRRNSGNPEIAYSILDSGLVFVDKALEYNPGNHAALRLKGSYYQKIGNHKEAAKLIEASFKDRTRSFVDYEWETFSYLEYDNYYEGLKSYLKYLELKPPELDVSAVMLDEVFRAFNETGFSELARSYAEKYLALTQDYDRYYRQMLMVERWQGNYRAEQEYIYRRWELDTSSRSTYIDLVSNYIYINKLDSAFHYLQHLEADTQRKGQNLSPNTVFGYVYMKLGQKSEAEYHLKGSLSYWKNHLKLKTPNAQKGTAYFWLAIIYSLLEDGPNTIKHLEYLKEFSTQNSAYYNDMKDLSCFDFVRNTPEFQSVLKHLEKVNRKKHRRIARLLKQQGYPFSQETNW